MFTLCVWAAGAAEVSHTVTRSSDDGCTDSCDGVGQGNSQMLCGSPRSEDEPWCSRSAFPDNRKVIQASHTVSTDWTPGPMARANRSTRTRSWRAGIWRLVLASVAILLVNGSISAQELEGIQPVRLDDSAAPDGTAETSAQIAQDAIVSDADDIAGEDEGDLDDELDDLLDQDLSSLRRTSVTPALDVEVSTVSRQQSTIGRSPAAVFVIDEEMIRRSGARRVPDLLRMVPGLFVGNIDGSKWSISSRGFTNRFANKLLVQIDGRTVYTPLFGGVFWDVQGVLLDDIKRIEVIRGPGATIWGANAVNGVINIITKTAAETHGAYAHIGGGSTEHGFAGARLGGRTENDVDWRVSAKWFDRDSFEDVTGLANDASHQGRIGFRTDWKNRCQDVITFQGDWYDGANNEAKILPLIGLEQSTEDIGGLNVLGRWSRVYDEQSDVSLQLYYDRTDRISSGFDQDTNTIDIDFQHRFSPWKYHQVIWGLGYRNIWDRLQNNQTPAFISANPQRRTLERVAAFLQDEVTLLEDRLYLTLGAKLSYNTYTQAEVQPSVRMLYLPNERSACWAAFSRAVRTPTRATEDIVLIGPTLPSPPFPPATPILVFGNRDIDSEELLAYEVGYRKQVNQRLSWDAALFFNDYEGLLGTRTIVPALGLPFNEFFNDASAHAYGAEISTKFDVNCHWKLQAWYSYLQIEATGDPTSNQDPLGHDGGTPANQAFLMSTWNVNRCTELDVITHYVDSIPFEGIPSYIGLDLRGSYRPSRHVEWTVVGQNLLDSSRPEYRGSPFTGEISTQVPRGVYGMMTLRY